MNSLVVLEQMVMIFILILTGFVLYKKKIISDGASKDLSALVVNVCSPGLIIVSMFNDLSQIPRENVIFVGIIGVIFLSPADFFRLFSRVGAESAGTSEKCLCVDDSFRKYRVYRNSCCSGDHRTGIYGLCDSL